MLGSMHTPIAGQAAELRSLRELISKPPNAASPDAAAPIDDRYVGLRRKPAPIIDPIVAIKEEQRQRSVVIAGLAEPLGDTPSARAKADAEAVEELLDLAKLEAVPVEQYRMGRPSQVGPRLVKVVLPSQSFQRKLLASCRRLRNENKLGGMFKAVFVRPSLNKQQREDEAALRKLLTEQRQADPDTKLMIFDGKIINCADRDQLAKERRSAEN